MNEIIKIRKQTSEDIIDYQYLMNSLKGFKKPRDKIQRMIKNGELIRIKQGLYLFSEPFRKKAISRELLANLIYGPSYVSLDYALSYFNLIPERVETLTSVCIGRSKVFDTPLGRFSYQNLMKASYSTGCVLEETEGKSFLIASPEKSLADKFWTDKRICGISNTLVEQYLLEDLRIDIKTLFELNKERLIQIGKAYNSKKIDSLIKYLLSIQGTLNP